MAYDPAFDDDPFENFFGPAKTEARPTREVLRQRNQADQPQKEEIPAVAESEGKKSAQPELDLFGDLE